MALQDEKDNVIIPEGDVMHQQSEEVPVEEQVEVLDQEVQEELQEETTEKHVLKPSDNEEVDKNFKKLREEKSKLERENSDLIRYLSSLNQIKKSVVPEEDLNINVKDDDYVEGKELQKLYKRHQKLEQQVKTYEEQMRQMQVYNQVISQYKDFQDVVTKDSIAELKEEDPETYDVLDACSDPYKQAIALYKILKKRPTFNESTSKTIEREVAKRNINSRPRMSNSVSPQQGESPLTRANAFSGGLTEDLKKQLYKEMLEACKKK